MKDCYGNFLSHYIFSKCQKIKFLEISEIIIFNKTNNDVKEQIDPLIPGLFD